MVSTLNKLLLKFKHWMVALQKEGWPDCRICLRPGPIWTRTTASYI